ncbi:MAG TPA: hypothetical protein VL501_03990, partial [Pyrinomonadaceae bacterium]|nr:hypothetical protein [Pyrinomonadaceae bacterium]
GKKDGFTQRQVAVRASAPGVAVYSTVVDVVVRIGEKRIERPFTMPAPGLAGKTISFTIYGPKTGLTKLKADDLKVEMALNDAGEEVPRVTLPADLADASEIRKAKLN